MVKIKKEAGGGLEEEEPAGAKEPATVVVQHRGSRNTIPTKIYKR